MDHFIQTVKAQSEDIEAEIQTVTKKLDLLREQLYDLQVVLKVYDNMKASAHEQNVRSYISEKPNVGSQVSAIIEDVLSDGQPRKTQELLPIVHSHNVQIGGKDQTTGLAAILSRKKNTFYVDRKTGWTLKRFVKSESSSVTTDADNISKPELSFSNPRLPAENRSSDGATKEG